MNLTSMSNEEILRIVDPIMDNLMQGSTEIDHEKHSRDFTERLKKIVTPDRLQKMCTDYQAKWGYFQEREFVALFRREDSLAVVWKQRCSKTQNEYVAEAVFIERNGKYLVDHAMVY